MGQSHIHCRPTVKAEEPSISAQQETDKLSFRSLRFNRAWTQISFVPSPVLDCWV